MTNHVGSASTKLQLPIEIIGSDLLGLQFVEHTRTLTIHRNGATIFLTNKLAPDSEVIVRNPETNEEALAFVVGQLREEGKGHVYSFAFLDPAADLWHIQFPAPGPAKNVQMECSRCRSVTAIPLSDIELEILDFRRELARSCSVCRSSTIWKETDRESTEIRPISPPLRDSASQASDPPSQERRRNKRTAMKVVACIQFSGREDVVAVEDISRSGFRFTSRREYPGGIRIDAAVPFAKASTNIFCPAYIIYCQKLSDGVYRHGVTYLKTGESTGANPEKS